MQKYSLNENLRGLSYTQKVEKKMQKYSLNENLKDFWYTHKVGKKMQKSSLNNLKFIIYKNKKKNNKKIITF